MSSEVLTPSCSRFGECEIYIPPGHDLLVAVNGDVDEMQAVEEVGIPEHFCADGGDPDCGRRLTAPGPWNRPADQSLWNLDRMDQCRLPLDGLHTRLDASGVRVYVLDTGVWGTHQDLVEVMAAQNDPCHASFVQGDDDPWWDLNGHG